MNRAEAIEKGIVYTTSEMLDLLVQKTMLSKETCEAVLMAWVGIVRSTVLKLAREDTSYRGHLRQGTAAVVLFDFVPMQYLEGRNGVVGRISQETRVFRWEVVQVLQTIVGQLLLLRGTRAVELLGFVDDAGGGAYSVIHLWPDFLSPLGACGDR